MGSPWNKPPISPNQMGRRKRKNKEVTLTNKGTKGRKRRRELMGKS